MGRFFYAINTRILNTLKELPVFDVLERRIYQLQKQIVIYIDTLNR